MRFRSRSLVAGVKEDGFKDLILYIAEALVDHPQDVRVLEEKGGAGVCLRILAHEEDRGRIIGKGGRTIRALRTLLFTAAGTGTRATLEVSDDEK